MKELRTRALKRIKLDKKKEAYHTVRHDRRTILLAGNFVDTILARVTVKSQVVIATPKKNRSRPMKVPSKSQLFQAVSQRFAPKASSKSESRIDTSNTHLHAHDVLKHDMTQNLSYGYAKILLHMEGKYEHYKKKGKKFYHSSKTIAKYAGVGEATVDRFLSNTGDLFFTKEIRRKNYKNYYSTYNYHLTKFGREMCDVLRKSGFATVLFPEKTKGMHSSTFDKIKKNCRKWFYRKLQTLRDFWHKAGENFANLMNIVHKNAELKKKRDRDLQKDMNCEQSRKKKRCHRRWAKMMPQYYTSFKNNLRRGLKIVDNLRKEESLVKNE